MNIQLCKKEMVFPTQIGELRESNKLIGNIVALNARMKDDGYLLFRSFHDPDLVMEARKKILSSISQNKTISMNKIAKSPEVIRILESPNLFKLFNDFYGEPAITFDFKWLRAVEPDAYTGIHYDNVYMGRGSKRLLTAWTPFGNTPPDLGTLAVCVGSHKSAFQKLQKTYGQIDVDRDEIRGGGWFSHDPDEISRKFGGEWKTAHFNAGDIIIFGMLTLHCSTRNLTNQPRLSCDTRFQPISDKTDDRWYGPNQTGHTLFGNESSSAETIEEAKKRWGV